MTANPKTATRDITPRDTLPALAGYLDALDQSILLSDNTRRAYASRVAAFCDWLCGTDVEGDPFTDPGSRDGVVRDYRRHLVKSRGLQPSTVNATLTAIDHFYGHLELGPAAAKREHLPNEAPRGLSERDQRRFLRAVEHCPSLRDRAIALTLFYTGVRVAECAALDVADIELSARKGKLIVRAGKGERYREVPLHHVAREVLHAWLTHRRTLRGHGPALWLNRSGGRLSAGSINDLIVRLGDQAGIEDPVTPHVLRHTLGTRLVREGVDIVIVAELLGHADVNTTRRYALPTAEDKAAALNRLVVDS